MKVVYVGDKTM